MTVLSRPVRCTNAPARRQPSRSRNGTAVLSIASRNRESPAACTSSVTCRNTDIGLALEVNGDLHGDGARQARGPAEIGVDRLWRRVDAGPGAAAGAGN